LMDPFRPLPSVRLPCSFVWKETMMMVHPSTSGTTEETVRSCCSCVRTVVMTVLPRAVLIVQIWIAVLTGARRTL
jgi:hypothetical protein